MIIKYQNWLESYKELNTEAGTQTKLDASNGTKNKAKVLKGQLSAADVAKQNHLDRLHYEFCVFGDDEDIPDSYVTVVPRNKHVGVNFLDQVGRRYLTYLFHEVKEDRTLFLREIWYYNFSSESTENEDYRLHFVFDETGQVNYRKYDEQNEKIQDYESNKLFVVDGLYEKYPEFDQYEGITKLDRDFPVDIVPTNTNPNNTTDLPNRWLPPDWNKN